MSEKWEEEPNKLDYYLTLSWDKSLQLTWPQFPHVQNKDSYNLDYPPHKNCKNNTESNNHFLRIYYMSQAEL